MINLSNTLYEINILKKCLNSSLKSIPDHFYMYFLDILLDCERYDLVCDVQDTLRDFL